MSERLIGRMKDSDRERERERGEVKRKIEAKAENSIEP